jgi:hypothetical protein
MRRLSLQDRACTDGLQGPSPPRWYLQRSDAGLGCRVADRCCCWGRRRRRLRQRLTLRRVEKRRERWNPISDTTTSARGNGLDIEILGEERRGDTVQIAAISTQRRGSKAGRAMTPGGQMIELLQLDRAMSIVTYLLIRHLENLKTNKQTNKQTQTKLQNKNLTLTNVYHTEHCSNRELRFHNLTSSLP